MKKCVLLFFSVTILSTDFAQAIPIPADLQTAIDQAQRDCKRRKSAIEAVLRGKFHPNVKADVNDVIEQLNGYREDRADAFDRFKQEYDAATTDEERAGRRARILEEIQTLRLGCRNMMDGLATRAAQLQANAEAAPAKRRSSTR